MMATTLGRSRAISAIDRSSRPRGSAFCEQPAIAPADRSRAGPADAMMARLFGSGCEQLCPSCRPSTRIVVGRSSARRRGRFLPILRVRPATRGRTRGWPPKTWHNPLEMNLSVSRRYPMQVAAFPPTPHPQGGHCTKPRSNSRGFFRSDRRRTPRVRARRVRDRRIAEA